MGVAEGPPAVGGRRWRQGLQRASGPQPPPLWKEDYLSLNCDRVLGGRDKTGATPRSLARLALTTSLPATWGGVGVSVEGGWGQAGWWASSPMLWARGSQARPRGHFLPLLMGVLFPGRRPHGGCVSPRPRCRVQHGRHPGGLQRAVVPPFTRAPQR